MQTFVTGLNILTLMILFPSWHLFPSPISQRISAHIPVLVVYDAADRDFIRCLQSDRELASCPPAPAPYGMELFAQWRFPSPSRQEVMMTHFLPTRCRRHQLYHGILCTLFYLLNDNKTIAVISTNMTTCQTPWDKETMNVMSASFTVKSFYFKLFVVGVETNF